MQLFNLNIPYHRDVLTMAIVVLVLLTAAPFTARAQEQESDVNPEVLAERLASCVHEWDCFDVFDFKQETVLVNVSGALVSQSGTSCRGNEDGIGWVTLGGRKGSVQFSSFSIQGLEFVWLFGDPESGYYDYRFSVRPDGTGLYYDFSNIKEGESVGPSQRFACIDRSEEAVDRMVNTLGFGDAKE